MITVTFSSDNPAQDKQDIDDFCYQNNYQDVINGEPNPQTKVQYAKQVISQFIKDSIVRGRQSRVSTVVNVTVS